MFSCFTFRVHLTSHQPLRPEILQLFIYALTAKASVVWNYPTGWGAITLDTPFPYDPTQSLIVDIGQCAASAGGGILYFTTQTNTLRVWSVGGCPFVCYASSSVYNYDMGINVGASSGPPIVTTTAATAVTGNAATLNGTVNANGASATVSFEYGLTTTYGSTVAGVPSPVTGTSAVAVSAGITGLTANTLYHFRCKGVNSNGTTNGNDMTFTTLGPPPTVITTAATAVAGTTATVNGTVNANNANTTTSFDYGLTTTYGTNVPGVPLTVTGSIVTAVSANLVGLAGGTLYHYRINGTSANGTSNGNDMTFTTTGAPPTVVTTAAGAITATTATLNGTVAAGGFLSTCYFQYGLTTAYGTQTASVPPTVPGIAVTPISLGITGLSPGVLYHFRAIATNLNGDTYGNDMTFTTLTQAPTVITYAATGVNTTVATLNGLVTANGAATTIWFDYGLTVGYGTSVAGTPPSVIGNTATTSLYNAIGLTNATLYHYRIRAVNAMGTTNGADMTFTTGCFTAGPAGPITGPTQACQGGSGYVYSVAPISNASGYVWTVPVGGTITLGANTNTITVSYSPTAVAGYIYVYGIAGCGNGSPAQLGVAMNPYPAPTITGPAGTCANVAGNVYTTQPGMTNYNWAVSIGGFITAGGTPTSNTATVTWVTTGAKTISVNYNSATGCSGLASTVYNVTNNPLPVPTITGPSPACSNFPGQVYTTQAGMSGYSWTISAGGTITSGGTTNAVTVTWTGLGAQSISVNYTNANGCTAVAPVTYAVTVNASPTPTITGPANLCLNSGFITYTTQPGMTGYTWTISSGGVINYGATTNTATVTWNTAGTQWIRVNYTNASGCSAYTATQFDVTVNGLPGAAGSITGTATVCAGTDGVTYSVPVISGAVSYIWTLPTGASNATGSLGNSITVDFAANASSGNITVVGNNMCGNGASSPPFAVTVTPLPVAPVVTNTGYILYSDAAAGNQWYYSTTIGGTGAPISGAVLQTYDATLTGTGYYWSVVTLSGCSSDTSNHKYIVVTGVESQSASGISLYPVPNDGRFNVIFSGTSNDTYTISVFNSLGLKIFEEPNVEVNGPTQKVIDLRPVPNGVYTVIIENSLKQVVKKIVVNK
ncbi:MAG: T9SS type A sorting domain-containing protein [Bacteroidetes bacterium]|nr:T9SS type A sorting domain-containing protein [Bacteroidota bacterium]